MSYSAVISLFEHIGKFIPPPRCLDAYLPCTRRNGGNRHAVQEEQRKLHCKTYHYWIMWAYFMSLIAFVITSFISFQKLKPKLIYNLWVETKLNWGVKYHILSSLMYFFLPQKILINKPYRLSCYQATREQELYPKNIVL